MRCVRVYGACDLVRGESVLVRDVYIVLRKKERELFQGTHR